MSSRIAEATAWLHRRAENVAAAMLGLMFVAFVLQVIFRYLLNFPIGWSTELTLILWLYLVLWGSAFVLSDEEEIRFDLVAGAVRPRTRAIMSALGSAAVVLAYGYALPATYAYVSFMKVEKSSYLKIPLNWLYAIYLVFCVAVMLRCLWSIACIVRGQGVDGNEAKQAGSGL